GAADPRNEYHLLLRETQRGERLFHLRQDRIVATTRTPSHILIAGQVFRRQGRKGRNRRHKAPLSSGTPIAAHRIRVPREECRGCPGHHFPISYSIPFHAWVHEVFADKSCSIFSSISLTRNGRPWILFRPIASTRNSARSSKRSCPALSSGTRT